MPAAQWRIRLTEEAQRDYADIIVWTADRFGLRQVRRYAAAIESAISELTQGTDPAGSRASEILPADLRILPIARRGVRANHALIFKAVGISHIEIIRILHSSMDLAQHPDPQ